MVECNFVAIFSIVVLDVPDVALRPSVLQLLWKGRGHPNDLYWTIRMVEISYKVSRSGTKASEIWFGVWFVEELLWFISSVRTRERDWTLPVSRSPRGQATGEARLTFWNETVNRLITYSSYYLEVVTQNEEHFNACDSVIAGCQLLAHWDSDSLSVLQWRLKQLNRQVRGSEYSIKRWGGEPLVVLSPHTPHTLHNTPGGLWLSQQHLTALTARPACPAAWRSYTEPTLRYSGVTLSYSGVTLSYWSYTELLWS